MVRKLDDKSETERLQLLVPASWLAKVDEWRGQQPKPPNRSDAIRQLVELGLIAKIGNSDDDGR